MDKLPSRHAHVDGIIQLANAARGRMSGERPATPFGRNLNGVANRHIMQLLSLMRVNLNLGYAAILIMTTLHKVLNKSQARLYDKVGHT